MAASKKPKASPKKKATAVKKPKASPKKKATAVPSSLVVRLEMFFTLASDTAKPRTKRWMSGRRAQKAQFLLDGTALPAVEANGIYKIPYDSLKEGAQEIEVKPEAAQTSDRPGCPSTGSAAASGATYQYRRFKLKLSVSKTDKGRKVDDTPEVVLIPELMKISPAAKYTSPAAYALLFTWSGKKQELVIDWKPDWIRSGNFNARGRTAADIEVIVVHGTATSNPPFGTLSAKRGKKSVSVHYVLDLDGHITKMVHEANVAWHAGGSFWNGKKGINSNSVGIEIVHKMGNSEVKKPPARPYPEDQYAGLMVLMESLLGTYTGVGRMNVVGHSDIATTKGTLLGNKMDPYYDFQWVRLEDAGMARKRAKPQNPPSPGSRTPVLGVEDGKVYKFGSKHPAVAQVKQALKDIGYSIASTTAGQSTVTEKYDEAMRQAVFSVQTRYWSDPNFRGIEPKDRGKVDYKTAYAIQKVLEDK